MIVNYPDYEASLKKHGWKWPLCNGCRRRRSLAWVNFCGHGLDLCGYCLKIVQSAHDRINEAAENHDA